MHSAKLIWVTPDAEQLIGKIARVSNPKNEDNPNVEGLLKYLIKHKHWSPFEMASMCVEIHTTRAIAPQILRHRSFSFQEFSQRYAIPTDTFATVLPELRRQDTKNRQNSIDDVKPETAEYFKQRMTITSDKEYSYMNPCFILTLLKSVLVQCSHLIQSPDFICLALSAVGCITLTYAVTTVRSESICQSLDLLAKF